MQLLSCLVFCWDKIFIWRENITRKFGYPHRNKDGGDQKEKEFDEQTVLQNVIIERQNDLYC